MMPPWTRTSPGASIAIPSRAGSSPRPIASPTPPAGRRGGRAARAVGHPALSPRLLPADAASGIRRQGLYLAARPGRRGRHRACTATTRTPSIATIRCRSVFEQQKTVRVRLDQVEPQAPLLRQLKDEGATDYVALPLLFTTGHVDALSVVSRQARRLLDHRPRPHVPAAVRLHAPGRDPFPARHRDHLLDAYVGRAAGQRILAGEVRRGDGQTIEAVIWYCDLRGFTRLSDTPAARRDHRAAQRLLRHDGRHRDQRRRRDPEVHG